MCRKKLNTISRIRVITIGADGALLRNSAVNYECESHVKVPQGDVLNLPTTALGITIKHLLNTSCDLYSYNHLIYIYNAHA